MLFRFGASRTACGAAKTRQDLRTGTILGAGIGLALLAAPQGAKAQFLANINMSTDFTVNSSSAGYQGGISVTQAGAGKVIVQGLTGPITANGDGISITGSTGPIDIGGTAGLGVSVTSTNIGIVADTQGAISIRTVKGGDVGGIFTKGFDANTTIAIGSTIGAGANGFALFAVTHNGAVTIANSGVINGAIFGTVTSLGSNNLYNYTGSEVGSDVGHGKFTLNNTGTINLGAGSISGDWTINNAGVITSSSTIPLGAGTSYPNLGKPNIDNLAGGVLTGTGTFGSVTAEDGSFIRPGDRSAPVNMGVLRTGSLLLSPGATLDVRADYSGKHDALAVTGTATITDAKLLVHASPDTQKTWLAGPQTFTVLTTTQNLVGAFATVETDLAFLKAKANYANTSVTATLERRSFAEVATNKAQRSIGTALEPFATDQNSLLISNLLGVTDGPAALQQLAAPGLGAARAQGFAAAALFSDAISAEMGRFTGSASGGGALSYIEDTRVKTNAFKKIEQKPEPIADGRVWAQALGGAQTFKENMTTGAPRRRAHDFGVAAGVDTALNPRLRVGVAVSGGQSNTKVASLATTADSGWGQGALYAVLTDGALYAKTSLSVGRLSSSTERSVNVFSAPETATGKFSSMLYAARVEIGQHFELSPVNLTPFLAFQPSLLSQSAYKEKSAGEIALGFNKSTATALPGTLGVRFDADIDLGTLRLTPSTTLGWVHNFANAADLTPYFLTLPGAGFATPGAETDRDLARAEISLEARQIGGAASLYLNARGDLGQRTRAVRGAGGMLVRF